MKLLFILPGLSFGGAERVVSVLANEFDNQGDRVSILTIASTGKSAYSLNPSIQCSGLNLENGKNVRLVYEHIKAIRNKIKEVNPDIIISFITDAALVSIIANMGLKYPLIVSERNDPGRQSIKMKIIRSLLYPLATGFVFQSEGAKKYFSKNIQRRSVVIMNPLCIENIPKLYEGEREKEVVTVGRLVAQKNQSLLIKAFAKFHEHHKEYKLVIYGEGKLKKELMNEAECLNIKENVQFKGNVKDVLEKIKKASIFAFTSNFEGVPNALAEAMALGLPCIATNCSPGGAAMLISSYINGILISVDAEDELVQALEYMTDNPLEAQRMGNAARKIAEHLSSDKIVSNWREYIEHITSCK